MASKWRRLPVAAAMAGAALAVGAVPSMAANGTLVRMAGYKSPGTPAKYNKVGVLEFGPASAPNVLVLNPGTSASAAYFAPVARDIVRGSKGWQVWSVERRENLLEDHSEADRVKTGKAGGQELYNYYLGYLQDSGVTNHFQQVPEAQLAFAKRWGMRTEIEDLRRVVLSAEKRGGKVVVGGHSLGGSITSAYATWDFGGRPGAKGLSGLVFIDGGSGPTGVSVDQANASLASLRDGSPFLAFGGIPAPFAGLFNIVSSGLTKVEPDAPARLANFSALPASLKAPVPVTNVGGYGYGLDNDTSPASFRAGQAHMGRLAASGDPRGWDQAGEITPIQRYADMFFGSGLPGLDGTAWYHPMRLTIDSGAVAAGNANPAQRVLGVKATHGDDLPRSMRLYAFATELGSTRVLDAARALAGQSGIPRRLLTLVNRSTSYSHNDPNSASPKNDFVSTVVPYLKRVAQGR